MRVCDSGHRKCQLSILTSGRIVSISGFFLEKIYELFIRTNETVHFYLRLPHIINNITERK